MADDQFSTSGNWWDTERNRYDSGASQPSSSGVLTTIANFAWQSDMVDMKPRSFMDSMAVSSSSSMIFQDNHKLQTVDSASTTDPNLHMMALGLSTEPMDWNQPSLLRVAKAPETSFRSMLQENMNSPSTNLQHETGMGLSQVQWREKLFSGGCTPDETSTNEFKQVNRGFSLDQPHHQFSPQYSSGDSTSTCQGLPSSFRMDSSTIYGNSSVLHGVIRPEHSNQPQQPAINLKYPASYGFKNNSSTEPVPSWSKVPQFLRASPPKQAPDIQFDENSPFWNATEPATKIGRRPSFFPSLQSPFSTPQTQSKNISSEVRDSSAVAKKSGSTETASKRPRNETSPPMTALKVRKEKMGDRITALQQLVSPFGKTDTASVLSEAIEYIKFLHEQVTALSSPYMKSAGSMHIHQQINSGKSKESEGPKQDLRSRGLCLVPVSSTFPVTHENPVDIWIPTFGGTFG